MPNLVEMVTFLVTSCWLLLGLFLWVRYGKPIFSIRTRQPPIPLYIHGTEPSRDGPFEHVPVALFCSFYKRYAEPEVIVPINAHPEVPGIILDRQVERHGLAGNPSAATFLHCI